MIELFEHNQTAYEAAAAMLVSEGKAAVIHPTETGKSFIAFKLCQRHPSACVCWLSPSEYIFRTQLESIEKASHFTPGNVRFLTYAKLMLLFCSDREHMKKIAGLIPGWFGKVDSQPHIYEVFAESSEPKNAFQSFKQDESEHLKLPQEKKRRLIELGMEWQKRSDAQWEEAYEAAVRYHQRHGELNVPAVHCEDAIPLGRWIYHQRKAYASGKISHSRMEKLSVIGMEWKPLTQWERSFAQARQYFEEQGHLQPSSQYITPGGLWLDRWLCAQRKAYAEGRLSADQISLLESIGIHWQTKMDILWAQRFEELASCCSQCGNLEAMASASPNDMRLKRGYARQNKRTVNGTLSPWQVEKLKTIGLMHKASALETTGVEP